MSVVIIMGSEVDRPHVEIMVKKLESYNTKVDTYVASAHKTPKVVLEVLEKYIREKVVFITVAGRSNALSGFCAANTAHPVLACPPFSDKMDMMVNIHSTLQMPSNVPVMTVLDPKNCALAACTILRL